MATSTRRFVSQLSENESIDQVFLASDKQLRPNRNGNLYLQVELSDRSGRINARMWNATEGDYRSFDNGDYVHVDGATQIFQGAIQLIANRIRRVPGSEVDESDFLRLASPEINRLASRLAEMLRAMQSEPLRALAECFLADSEFMNRYMQAPAAIKHHHAYHGGLIEHVVNLMEVVLRITPCYPQLNADLLLMGVFLHDMGKVEELTYERDLAYSDSGQLLGHIVQAISMLDDRIREAEQLRGTAFPEEIALQLKHMIISHHGQYDYGSPKLPMTLEALALSELDSLDAHIHQFDHLMQSDANSDSPWTLYQHSLGRKLYKGPLPGTENP